MDDASFHSARDSQEGGRVIYPQKADTVAMAVLMCIDKLPEGATVRDCLEMYGRIKMAEIEAIGKQINDSFAARLQELEDELIGDSVPANSEEDNKD
jgi:hypothetical protein